MDLLSGSGHRVGSLVFHRLQRRDGPVKYDLLLLALAHQRRKRQRGTFADVNVRSA